MDLNPFRPPSGIIVHSDRDSQYASHGYQALLERHALTGSTGRRGNAVMERFLLNLKQERVWRLRCALKNRA